MAFDYEQQIRFMHLYNSAVEAQEMEARRRQGRRLSRYNSFDLLPIEHDRIRYPSLPIQRVGSSGKLDARRPSVNRESAESGYSSNREFYRGRSLERRLSKKGSSLSDTYEGYPQIRRVSVVRKEDDRPPTPPILKRKPSSMNSSRGSMSAGQSVRFSTVENIEKGAPWSGRYKPRTSISSDRDSHVTAYSINDIDGPYNRERRSSRASGSHRRRSSSTSRRDSVSSRRDSMSTRRASVSSRRSSRSSRRSSMAPESRRASVVSSRASLSYSPEMEYINPNGVEGAEIMRRLSRGGSGLKEWERSSIMSRRPSRSSRRSSTSSRRRSSAGFFSSNSSDSESDSDSASDSSSSYGSTTSGSDSSDSESGSESDSASDSDEEEKNKNSSRKTSSAETTPKNDVSEGGANGKANGVGTSPMKGGMALATDGGNFKYYQMEENNSSSFCVIL